MARNMQSRKLMVTCIYHSNHKSAYTLVDISNFLLKSMMN